MGEAMVCRREWTSEGETKSCAVFIAASRSVLCAIVKVELATRSASRASASKYGAGGLGSDAASTSGGRLLGDSSSWTVRGRKRDASVTGSSIDGWNTAGADRGCVFEDRLFRDWRVFRISPRSVLVRGGPELLDGIVIFG